MDTNSESRIEELAREKMAGKSYAVIRKELQESGMTGDEITTLIRQVDERVLRETIKQTGQKKAQQWYRLGMLLAVLGLMLSIAYNAGIVFRKFPALLIYSPFFAGILVMIYGRTMQKKQSGTTKRTPGAIRRRRPYK